MSTTPRPLTQTERDLLEYLRRIQHEDTGLQGAYTFSLPRGRVGILGRVTRSYYMSIPQLTKNRRTINRLLAKGHIEIGDEQQLPASYGPNGCGNPITITKLGRHAIS
jgi:hypothetical protein